MHEQLSPVSQTAHHCSEIDAQLFGWLAWDDVSATQGQVITKYYYAGSQRVAMRSGSSTLNFILGDHLGSASVTTSSTGTSPKYQLYKPFGEVRYTSGTLPTKYTFTGQYSNVSDFGLMYYGARFYDPVLGRFASADTIIPGAGNPLAWDRYSYTLNNPVKYTDPSGHWYKPGERGMQVGFGMGHIPLVGYGSVSRADQSKLDAAYVMLGRTDSGRSTAEFILSENVTFVLAVDFNELPTTYVEGENGSVQYSWAPLTVEFNNASITVEHPIKLGLGYPEYDTGQLAGIIVHEAYHANRAQKYGTCDSLEEEHSAYKAEGTFLAEARSKGYTNYDNNVNTDINDLLLWSNQSALYNRLTRKSYYDGYPLYPSNDSKICLDYKFE